MVNVRHNGYVAQISSYGHGDETSMLATTPGGQAAKQLPRGVRPRLPPLHGAQMCLTPSRVRCYSDWLAAAVVIAVGSVSVDGLGILTGVLPLLYPERGTQMSFMLQAVVLLVSSVYDSVDVLPAWLQVFSHISPATYLLDGIRGAIIDGQGVDDMLGTLALVLVGVILVPGGIAVFAIAERWARKTGQLKRQG